MTAWIHRLALGLTLALAAQHAFADDLADEADLHFERGAAAYQRGDYGTALERFLLSNRIVPNRNVVFNIARCYERLGKAAEAYRAYDQARAGESDPAVLASIDAELRRIGTKVAVLSIASEPPGATIYIERRDLGPRGVTPRRLALGEGQYHVIVELPGYQPATVDSGKVILGQTKELNFVLQPILGQVTISGEPGTKVVADDIKTGPSCEVPCVLNLPLGMHTLYASRAGYNPEQTDVEVQEGKVAQVVPQLEPQTGSIVVSTDEPNALIEIDGKPRGFTPVVVTLPAGAHRLRLTLDGFHPLERTVKVRPEQQERVHLELIQSERVEGASRRVESVENTASSVSIVPQYELSAMAYPTLAESLRGSPGIYLWDDRNYVGVGMRGLGRLGSYGNRVLVLVDGVATNDNWIGSSYVGYDAFTDLGDVERVELIRGPGSAVYGTSAFSGVINVVTRRETNTGVEVGASTNSDGVARGRVRVNLSNGANSGLYASAAIGRSGGREFYLPELATDSAPHVEGAASGWSRGLDGMRNGTLRGRAHHGIWSVQWLWHRYEKQLPNAPFETVFGDPATRQMDERGFLELRAEPRFSSHTSSVSSITLNRYRFRGDYAHPITTEGLEVDTYHGHWVTVGERVVHHFDSRASLTVGGEATWHFDVTQRGSNQKDVFLNRSNPYGVIAGYGILDARLGSNVRVSWGARVDHYTTFGTSLNPRLGIVVKPYARGNTKFTFGRAFRAPSPYELWYNDGGTTQLDSPNLKPETMLAAEVEHTHRFSSTVVGSIGAYANTIRGLIDTTRLSDPGSESGNPEGGAGKKLLQFEARNPIVAVGTELGLRREWRSGWMVSAYYGFTRTRFLKDSEFSSLIGFKRDPKVRNVANSPVHSATIKAVAPFLVRAMNLGTRFTLEDGRWDRYESTTDPVQHRSAAAVIWDLVLSMEDARHRLRGALGVYNVFDWRYQYPVGKENDLLRAMPAIGRTLLISADLRL